MRTTEGVACPWTKRWWCYSANTGWQSRCAILMNVQHVIWCETPCPIPWHTDPWLQGELGWYQSKREDDVLYGLSAMKSAWLGAKRVIMLWRVIGNKYRIHRWACKLKTLNMCVEPNFTLLITALKPRPKVGERREPAIELPLMNPFMLFMRCESMAWCISDEKLNVGNPFATVRAITYIM